MADRPGPHFVDPVAPVAVLLHGALRTGTLADLGDLLAQKLARFRKREVSFVTHSFGALVVRPHSHTFIMNGRDTIRLVLRFLKQGRF